MPKVEDGGSAFPLPKMIDGAVIYRGSEGMSLRDYFAGQALSGMLTSPDYSNRPASLLAKWAYELSDAMLAERNRPNE